MKPLYLSTILITIIIYVGTIATIAQAAVDTDGDGYTDSEEVFLGTDPNDVDTDDDAVTDYQEALLNTDPLEYDAITDDEYVSDYALDNDADGLTNLQEEALGSSPLLADSDEDGYTDDEENQAGSDPINQDEDTISILDHGALVIATAVANGQVVLSYEDGYANTVIVFSHSTKQTLVRLLPDGSEVVVLSANGQRLKILNEDGIVQDAVRVRQQRQG